MLTVGRQLLFLGCHCFLKLRCLLVHKPRIQLDLLLDKLQLTIGIIGPKRMDYEKVLGTLRTLMNQLDTAFKKDER